MHLEKAMGTPKHSKHAKGRTERFGQNRGFIALVKVPIEARFSPFANSGKFCGLNLGA
jgi:hypothetical protein